MNWTIERSDRLTKSPKTVNYIKRRYEFKPFRYMVKIHIYVRQVNYIKIEEIIIWFKGVKPKQDWEKNELTRLAKGDFCYSELINEI